MKVRIEITGGTEEDEIIIKCKELNLSVQKIQQYIAEQSSQAVKIVFYKENEEYYFSLTDVLFFETEKEKVYAHTAGDVYQIKFRLYELEEMLPGQFARISKSAILNVDHIYSIQRNLTAASLVRFNNSHRQVYVSRSYYKTLKNKIDERRSLL